MIAVPAAQATPDDPLVNKRAFSFTFVRAIVFAFVLIGVWPIAAHPQNTWLGTTGTTGNWNDPTMWLSGAIPNGSTNILIPNGTVLDNFNINSQNSFQLTVSAPGALNILSTTTLNAPGAKITNSGLFTNSGVVNQQIFENQAGGILNNSGGMANFNLQNDSGGTVNNSGTLVEPQKAFVNEGVFNNSGGVVAAGLFNVGSANNTGEIVLKQNVPGFFSDFENAGTFKNQVGGTITNTGNFQNDAGATLTNLGTITDSFGLSNSGTFNNSGTYTFNPPATSEFLNLGSLNNTGRIEFGAAAFVVDFGSVTNSAGGQITNDGDFQGNKEQTFTNAGTLTNNATLVNGSFFVNSGVVNNLGSFQNNESSLQIVSGGVINNSLTGAIGNTGGAGFAVLNGGTLNNSGIFIVDSQSSFTMAAGSTVINNATGQMNLSTNTPQVVAAGNLLNNGSITMVAPPSTGTGSLFLPPPTLVIASTGTLSGTGFITGSVSNFGTVRPGDLTGTLTIFGLYQQMTGSTLDIWLGGANAGQFGQLAVNGDAALGGTLDVELYAGFDPESGEIFEILSGNISGAFADVDLPTLGDGLFFKLDQEANGVFLDVEGSTSGGGNGGGSTTAPEPAEWMLLLSGLFGLFAVRSLARRNQPRRTECA